MACIDNMMNYILYNSYRLTQHGEKQEELLNAPTFRDLQRLRTRSRTYSRFLLDLGWGISAPELRNLKLGLETIIDGRQSAVTGEKRLVFNLNQREAIAGTKFKALVMFNRDPSSITLPLNKERGS